MSESVSFTKALRTFVPDAKTAELAAFLKARSDADRKQFAAELSDILGVTVEAQVRT